VYRQPACLARGCAWQDGLACRHHGVVRRLQLVELVVGEDIPLAGLEVLLHDDRAELVALIRLRYRSSRWQPGREL